MGNKDVDKDIVISLLNRHRAELETFGIDHLRIFGSVARGEARQDSDVDILAEFRPEAKVGFSIVSIHRKLEEILGRKVDLMRAPVRNQQLLKKIEKESVIAF
ncbi:MAG: nucleotidyltransferase domain-containing protein [Aquisalinus sp.]|nr:nucleotidyltransferase domain-containing protein [Aquisalinus sp.]